MPSKMRFLPEIVKRNEINFITRNRIPFVFVCICLIAIVYISWLIMWLPLFIIDIKVYLLSHKEISLLPHIVKALWCCHLHTKIGCIHLHDSVRRNSGQPSRGRQTADSRRNISGIFLLRYNRQFLAVQTLTNLVLSSQSAVFSAKFLFWYDNKWGKSKIWIFVAETKTSSTDAATAALIKTPNVWLRRFHSGALESVNVVVRLCAEQHENVVHHHCNCCFCCCCNWPPLVLYIGFWGFCVRHRWRKYYLCFFITCFIDFLMSKFCFFYFFLQTSTLPPIGAHIWEMWIGHLYA